MRHSTLSREHVSVCPTHLGTLLDAGLQNSGEVNTWMALGRQGKGQNQNPNFFRETGLSNQ